MTPTGRVAASPSSGYEEVAELLRVNRALRTLSGGNRALLRAHDEAELLRAMCQVIVHEGGYRLAGVTYVVHDEHKSLEIQAYALEEDTPVQRDFFDHLSMTWADNELGRHAVAVAVRTGAPCIGRNLLTDPGHAHWSDDAARLGYASLSAFPLHIDGEIAGTLSIAASEADAFDESEAKLLEELADDLAYGISNLRVRVRHAEAEMKIKRLAFGDSLTGLPNRAGFREQFQAAIATAMPQRRPLALLLLGVDNLHEINDTLGYRQGDLLLTMFAQRLAQGAQEGQIVARIGEAEFVLLLPATDTNHAVQTAKQLSKVLRQPIDVAGLSIELDVSVGIALFPGHGADADILIRRARVALFDARRAGRDDVVFNAALDTQRTRRLGLSIDLRRAIENDELVLYFQPKHHLSSNRICGAEVLLRWPHPVHGMVPTGEFVRLAESTGLIHRLTHWVLDAAFRQTYIWHESGLDLPLAVNLSAHDLRDTALIDNIQGQMATWGTEPEWVQFELTESFLMEDPVSALDVLTRIKRLGVGLYIDDFGIGYSSMSYLHKLPVDALKIDQSFIRSLPDSDAAQAIVHSVSELGHRLGLEVVAEGVESEIIFDRMGELGCDTAQGYYIGQPMAADEFREWYAVAGSNH
jgi:diguanylate cyclase (GGDEF)-like protein